MTPNGCVMLPRGRLHLLLHVFTSWTSQTGDGLSLVVQSFSEPEGRQQLQDFGLGQEEHEHEYEHEHEHEGGHEHAHKHEHDRGLAQ